MIAEVRALVDTYLEGAGIFAWRENGDHSGYEIVALPPEALAVTLDDVLYRIATSIGNLMAGGQVPPPVLPERQTVDVTKLDFEKVND